MRKNAIKEFKVWSVFMAAGVSVLATEVVVKGHWSELPEASFAGVKVEEPAADVAADSVRSVMPEEMVADLLVNSVVQIESSGNPKAVGSRGERGLMQIMKSTWRETTRSLYGKAKPFDLAFDPDMNRHVGTAYLASLHAFLQANKDKWQADERTLLLACYNAGPQRVADAGFSLRRLPRSTQDYVARASALHDVYLREYAMRLEKGAGKGIMQIVQIDPSRRS